MNPSQAEYFRERHKRNIILKARQLGFSTLIDLDILDSVVFEDNFSAQIISYSLAHAMEIFETKIAFPYSKLPEWIKEARKATTDSASELALDNGSMVAVGTTARGGTKQRLHVSEFGKISAKYPDKAREIVTGAFNAVPSTGRIDIESTAEGEFGRFYEMTMLAMAAHRQGGDLTDLDFKFHFFAWWQEQRYSLPHAAGAMYPETVERYFRMLADEHGITLTDGQKLWYYKQAETQAEDMKREYPSYPEEAFEQAVEGAYYAKQLSKADTDGRICSLPYDTRLPVHTFWDIGVSDDTSIWFMQLHPSGRVDVIDFYAFSGEGMEHYARVLNERGYHYGRHFGPHDIEQREMGTGKSVKDTAKALGITFQTVPRTVNVNDDINATRVLLGRCWFDKVKDAEGLKALRAYRRAWNEQRACFADHPLHDWSSHAADAFRTGAVSIPEHPDAIRRLNQVGEAPVMMGSGGFASGNNASTYKAKGKKRLR
ncbi:MAG: hypothetical protein K2Q12_08010 [Rickettsiales bacterium]|nr:hypothetical protein [Rickettsiales bacterium]